MLILYRFLIVLLSLAMSWHARTAKAMELYDHASDLGCLACHLPISEDEGTQGATTLRKWDRRATGSSDFLGYLSNEQGNPIGPTAGPTLACLTCHDGAIANRMIGFDNTKGGAKDINLENSHPVMVAYDSMKTGYAPKSAVEAAGLRLYSGSLAPEQVECSTCHDVHNKFLVPDGKYLRAPRDIICTICHTF